MSSDMPLTNTQIVSIMIVVASLVGGQFLFKMSSQHVVLDRGAMKLVLSLFTWEFILALVLYGISTLVWVVLLKYLPLSRAYPFVALSFVLLPIVSYFLIGEALSTRYFVGLAVFMSGLYLIASA